MFNRIELYTMVTAGDGVGRETVLTVKEGTHGGNQNDFSTLRDMY